MTDGAKGDTWIAAWLDDVAGGRATMSQRAVSSVEKYGGIERLVDAARGRSVHLVRLTDDEGKGLVAASLKPFFTLC